MRFCRRCGKRGEIHIGDQRTGWREWDIKHRSVKFCEFALKSALRVANDEMIFIQIEAERICAPMMVGGTPPRLSIHPK